MLSRRMAWAVAVVATLTMTVSYIDRTTLAVLAISVSGALGISDEEYGWLNTAFPIAYLIGAPLAGRWIDRIGARRGLAISVLVWTAVAALHAVVPGFWVLFGMRIALGLAESPSFPGAAQTVQRVLPAADHPRGYGLLFTGSSVGGMIVPVLAALLYNLAGWRVAFLGTALAGVIWLPLWISLTRRPAVAEKLDALPLATSSEMRASLGEMLRDPNVQRAVIAIFAAAPSIGFVVGWGAKYLAREFHVAQGSVGGYLWLAPLLLDLGAVLFGDLATRQRRAAGAPPRLLVAIGMGLVATLALLTFASTPWTGVWVAAISLAGGGAMYTLVTADLLARVAPHNVAQAGGVLAASQSLAQIITSPLIGYMVGAEGGYDGISILLGLWAIPGALVWILWKPRS
ncbi:MAG: MFS transporter [Kofleriaceae bacterium]|nr:MFS transporter [Kofleriaceae bacterium]